MTPSVCRELSLHVGGRAAMGTALLIGTFEAAPWIKRQALAAFGRDDVISYKQEGALLQKGAWPQHTSALPASLRESPGRAYAPLSAA